MPQYISWKTNRSVIKYVIYKYPATILTLPAFYQFVCCTILIAAGGRPFSPRRQRRLFTLLSVYILLLWPTGREKTLTKSNAATVTCLYLLKESSPELVLGIRVHEDELSVSNIVYQLFPWTVFTSFVFSQKYVLQLVKSFCSMLLHRKA